MRFKFVIILILPLIIISCEDSLERIWHTESVDTEGDVGMYSSIDLDGDDNPHIAYCKHYDENMMGEVKYAYFDGSTWQIDIVDYGYLMGIYCSISVDSNDLPHIAYSDCYMLRYSHYDGIDWETYFLDDYGWICTCSLSLDEEDNPHISYYDELHKDLKYAHYNGQYWETGTVDEDGDVGEYNSMTVDSLNQPHIAYYGNGDLKYAHYDGFKWELSIVDSEGDVGKGASLAMDENDQPHISYFDNTNQNLKYAHHDGTTWKIKSFDYDGSSYISIALNSYGDPYISYYEVFDLKCVYYNGINWHNMVVDEEGEVGLWNDIVIDSSNRPHISYNDATLGFGDTDLKYAWMEEN